MVFVELKGYGDFGIEYTDSLWYHKGYDSIKGILSSEEFADDTRFDNAIKKLKEYGFVKVKTKSITIGGNL